MHVLHNFFTRSLSSPPPTTHHSYMSLSLALCFGVSALDKFKTRLHEFPQYCASIATIQHFQSFPNYLKQVGIVNCLEEIKLLNILLVFGRIYHACCAQQWSVHANGM